MSDDTGDSPLEAYGDAAEPLKTAIKPATLKGLLSKPRRVKKFLVTVPNDAGEEEAVEVTYQAIPPKEYDALMAAHPPVGKEKLEGALWNGDTFPAALIAAVSFVPSLTPVEAKELLDSPNYSGGEAGELFGNALEVCNRGLSVPFSGNG